MPMERYEIRGIYPDGGNLTMFVEVDNDLDAMAVAQGLRKVTTINEVAVLTCDDGRCIFHDRLQRNR